MLSFFKNIFQSGPVSTNSAPTTPTEADLKVLRELDINSAIVAHENWKIRLSAYLAGKSAEDLRPKVICFDDRCDLGKWLHGPARQQLGKYTSFHQLVAEHKNFHYHASNVVSLTQSGKIEEAGKMLAGVFKETSERVVKLLRGLS